MVKIQKNIRYKGVAVVEAAFVFPLLVLLTFGVIEYGWLFLKAQQITNAIRQGARVAIRADATVGDVEATIASLMENAAISYAPDDSLISDIDPGVGMPVTVSITVPCDENLMIMNIPLLPKPKNLGASVTMSKEGP